MSYEYLGGPIVKNPNHGGATVGVLDDAHPGRRERTRPRRDKRSFREQVVFVIPKECRSNDPVITEKNTKLVKFYEEIAQHLYERFLLVGSGTGKAKLMKSWENLQTDLKKAKTYQQDVRQVGGKAVSLPAHFTKEV